MLNKKIIKKEITLLQFLLLITGKLLIGIGIGISIAYYALPYSIPLIIIGVLILLPIFYSLFRVEAAEEKYLEKKLK